MNNMTDEMQNLKNGSVVSTSDFDASKKTIGIGESLTADGGALRKAAAPAVAAPTESVPLNPVGVPGENLTTPVPLATMPAAPVEPAITPDTNTAQTQSAIPSEPSTFIPPEGTLPEENAVYSAAQDFMNDTSEQTATPTLDVPTVPVEPAAESVMPEMPVASEPAIPAEPVMPVPEVPAVPVEPSSQPEMPVTESKPEVIIIEKAEYVRIMSELENMKQLLDKLVLDVKSYGEKIKSYGEKMSPMEEPTLVNPMSGGMVPEVESTIEMNPQSIAPEIPESPIPMEPVVGSPTLEPLTPGVSAPIESENPLPTLETIQTQPQAENELPVLGQEIKSTVDMSSQIPVPGYNQPFTL